MTEELVTLETAKMLRKKGFNEYCRFVIGEDRVISDIISTWNLLQIVFLLEYAFFSIQRHEIETAVVDVLYLIMQPVFS